MVNIHVDLTWLMYVADSPLQLLQDRTASRQSQSARSSEAGNALPAAVLSRTACTPQISHLAQRASNKLNFNPVVN